MELIHSLIDFILHLDKHLASMVTEYGTLTYAILFLIVFVETGLIVMPLLPGDSLLFAAGALAASTGALDVKIIISCKKPNGQINFKTYSLNPGARLGASGPLKYVRVVGKRFFKIDKTF